MTKIVAVNNSKLKCGTLSFKECSVVLRGKATLPALDKLFVSDLKNPSFIPHKTGVICYCDGLKEVAVAVSAAPEYDQFEYKEDVELEDPFKEYNIVEKVDLEEDIDRLYQKEKKSWICRFSKNTQLIEAINLGYECDEQYCRERIQQEYPGFFIVDHTTCFYKSKYPSQTSLNLEKRMVLQVNGSRAKYGTYVRIVELESHNHVEFNDCEAMVIFNYLHNFDIIAPTPIVELLYGQQFEYVRNRGEVFSN